MNDFEDLLQQISPHLDAVILMRESLNEETDRGCALLATSFLDQELGTLLRKYFVQDEALLSEIFKGASAPLASFSSRIQFAYLLGLIGRDIYNDLQQLRKIRNEFAHQATAITFETEKIKSHVTNLGLVWRETDTSRATFINVVIGLLSLIHANTLTLDSKKECEKLPYADLRKKTDAIISEFLKKDTHKDGEPI